LAAVAVAMFVATAQVADAQPEGGRRGRGGPGGRGFPVSSVRLATADEVQAALKLSDEQKGKVAEINDKLRDDVREVFQGGGGFEEMQKLNQEASAKLAEAFDESQQKRLMGILIQVNGPNALVEPAVMKELNVTDEQKTKLADIRESNMGSFRDAFQEMRDQDLSREEMRAKFDELRTDADKKLLTVLTSEQQAQLEALKGEPVEIDMSQFRGPGGRGGFDGRGRRGDRDNQESSGESSGGESSSGESSSEASSSSN
jgi:Spy/CpxP family protein refolding chaperone